MILHIVPMLFDGQGRVRGGAERYSLELAKQQARSGPVRLVSFGARDEQALVDGVDVRIIGGDWADRGRAHDPASTAILGHIRSAAVVHCHQREVRISKLSAMAARVARKRVVVTDHGGGAWSWASRIPAYRLFHAHLHVSEFSRALSGHPASPRTAVIGAGVDTERYAPAAAGNGSRRVLFVGRLLPHKGVDYLIEGLPAGLGLDVVGPASDARYVGDLEELARGRDVAFHHDWDDARAAGAYKAALCVVLPSVHRDRYGSEHIAPELLGQTLLEGMASGAPAICTAVGGMPEVVVAGETGFIVPPNDPQALGDALARLAANARERTRMAERARARVLEHFTWDAVDRRCRAAYGTAA